MIRCIRGRLGAALACSFLALVLVRAAEPQPILAYIKQTWTVLTRSNRDLAKAAADPKFSPAAGGRWPVYIARSEDLSSIEAGLRNQMPAPDFRKIEVRRLPADEKQPREPGLLYLPHPYVVPGGRFNEMYGWDSYFIQLGLLRDDQLELARDMADNFTYEIRVYGEILNANRTYYLTRSQPPFYTEMLLAVYHRTLDRGWLRAAVPAIESYYQYWTRKPHLTPKTGLSRYFDFGEGPAPEVLAAERDSRGRTHYDLVKEFLRTHRVTDYDASQYYNAKTNQLTPLFYKGDRSMRESGFDPSNRFGPFNLDIIHYDPVGLNSLLYLMEIQTAEIEQILNRPSQSALWRKRATERAERANRLLWDSQAGLYFDYNFVTQRRRHYPFLTTFYPLWAGIASREQAARIVRNLPLFERPGGLQTSTHQSGNQWDAPFGWAPLELIAVQGLRRYGYNAEANRISMHFLSLVRDEYRKHGTIVEKYDVVNRTSNVSGDIHYGYHSNEAGFGWTNAAFTVLYDTLPAKDREALLHPSAAIPAAGGIR